MKATKQVKQTLLQPPPGLDQLPPGLKKKGKLNHVTEPMVLMTSKATDNFAQYSIEIPSVTKDSALDEMDMLRNITVHLNQIVQTMEHVYTMDDKIKEEGEEEETLPKRERQDMVCFLIFCSQLSNQLDVALYEEKQILESLLKWFEKEVQMLEELGEEEIIPDWQVPVADKNITDNINKLMNRIQRLEDLKGRVQELPRYIRTSTPREKKRPLAPPPSVAKDPKNIIQELAMKHATEDVMNMVQVFQDDSGAPQTVDSMNMRMVEIMKIFERQTNKLHRVTNEQDVLESKLKKIQQDFQKLAEEKQIMEDELQKMKPSDIITQVKASADTRKKILAKLENEKAAAEEKTGAQPEKLKKLQKIKEPEPAKMKGEPAKMKEESAKMKEEPAKMKEDLAKAQANIQSLEREKKMLEEKLQKVLEEAGIAEDHFAEIPPDIPDWEFPYTTLGGNEKDVPKKSKKGAKLKGKASVTDGTAQKASRFDTVKAGEALPGKGQEISTVSQAKDGKPKKKGADLSDIEHSSLHKIPSAVSEKPPGKSEIVRKIPSKADAKGATKSKESVDLKKRSAVKGAGKEPHGSADTAPPPLPPDQETQQLPDLADQQAKSVEIASEKKKKLLPSTVPSVVLQEKASHLIGPKEFVGDSEKAAAIPRTSLRMLATFPGLQEDGIKDLIDEGMLQLADHLTELEGMPEAETLAKLLLEPSKGMEALSDTQKLQLISQLTAPEGQFPIPVEGQIVGKMDEEQREKKRRALENITSTLKLLDQTQAEAGQSVEEANEMAKMRRILLADLQSNLKDLQQAQAVVPNQQVLEKKISELTQKRSFLTSTLGSNLKDLKEAQAIAATQPSEMSKNKVKELLQERIALTACLEENQEEIQQAKSQVAVLAGKSKQEEVNELSEKRKMLLTELEKNVNDLEEALALAASEPSSMNDEKIKELTEQRNLLAASLETNLQDMEKAQAYVLGVAEETRLKQEKVNELSEQKKTLLANLKSNLKDLQEAQALAAIEPSTVNEEKVKELTEQRKLLSASLETNLHDLQKAQGYVPDLEERRLKQMEINEQSEKKSRLQERLELNLKNLQEAQMLATAQPNSMSELKLQELILERQNLTAELEAAVHVIQGMQREKELNELSDKKKLLLKYLASNLNDLREAQALAVAEPGSIAEQKLQELTEQRKYLAADLDATMHHMEEVQHQEKIIKSPEVELQELSDKKQLLLEKLQLTLKELQQAQALASAEGGSVSKEKLQELTEQRKQLTAELDAAIMDMQEIQLRDEILKSCEKEVQKLLEKKQHLLGNLVATLKELQEAQDAGATQPGSISKEKLKLIREKGKRLTADVEATVHDIKNAQRRASGRPELEPPGGRKLHDLSERKQLLLQNLKSNLKDLEVVQALADSEPDSEDKIQPLNEQRKLLTDNLDAIIQQMKETADRRVPETIKMPFVLKSDLEQLSQYKTLFLESLESNLKDLQEARILAANYPGNITEQKVHDLTEQRKLLAAGLKVIIEDIEEEESQAPIKDTILKTREIILEELYQKQRSILENLESNSKDLREAEALAAAQPDAMSENKIKKLTEQRRCLATGLEAIMEGIQEAEGLDREKLEILEKIEGELAELSENRQLLWKSMELNLNDLKGLQALALTEPDSMQAEKKQMLIEQRKGLSGRIEALLQDMEEAQSVDLRGGQMTGSDGRNINDLFEIKRLESKLDEIQQIGALSDVQLDNIKRKLSELKAKRGLDRWDTSLQGPLTLTKEELATYGLDDKAAKNLFWKGRRLSPSLQKSIKDMQQRSIRDLQQKSMILRGEISDKDLYKPKEDRSSLEQCLVTIPLKILEDDIALKYGHDGEQLAKRRALVAKLEANMKDLQAVYEAQTKSNEKLASEPSSKPLKPAKSGFHLQVGKVPEVKKSIHRHDIVPTVPKVGSETSIQPQQNKLPKKDMELELRKSFIRQVKRASLPNDLILDGEVQEILESNKVLLPVYRATLSEALAVAQAQLQRANLVAAQKVLCSQPSVPNTAMFHEYSLQPPRSAWEGSQLPVTDYVQKLIALKKKFISPELKELLESSSSHTHQAPISAATVEQTDSILICGKGYTGSRHVVSSHHKLSPSHHSLRND